MLINYDLLHKAEKFYEKKGFVRIEAPWWVPESIVKITEPKDAESPYFLPKNKKCLVASAEQSFLYLASKGLLPNGKFQATSPCFRDEVQGPNRRKFFMKNELIIVNPKEDDVSDYLRKTIDDCFEFFKSVVPYPEELRIVFTEIGEDIEYFGVELGSYGYRRTEFVSWIYATGVAEPRLSWAISKGNFEKEKKSLT